MVTLTCPVSNLILASVKTMIAWAKSMNSARVHSEDPLSFYFYLGAFFLYIKKCTDVLQMRMKKRMWRKWLGESGTGNHSRRRSMLLC